MDKVTIFSDSILLDTIVDNKLENLIKCILDEEEKTNPNNQISNYGGYQTKNIWNEDVCRPILKKASNLILKNYNFHDIQFQMLNLWINKNYQNNFNKPHNHSLSDFSGVYYIDVPEKNGELIFYRGDRTNQMMNIQKNLKGKDFSEDYVIQPLKNQLIIFPSHLQHMVLPHFEQKARISISFNIKVING